MTPETIPEAGPEAGPETGREALAALLDAMPGVTATPYCPPRSTIPLTALYKVMGKMFALLSLRGDAYVIVKTDPFMVDLLREQYAAVGHRTHLDRRFWIAIDLASDIPFEQITRLVGESHALVSASLTRKQQAELAALPPR